MTGTYRFADKVIRFTSIYPKVHEMCRDYRCEEEPDFTFCITPEALEKERQFQEKIRVRGGKSPADLEILLVYRMISEEMPRYDTFLFHGSAIAVDNKAYVFAAPSGTGKSTHARLWRELLGDRAVMVNDDKPLIRVTEEESIIFGTPWNGKHHLSRNIAVP
ncbi:MAG: hypothetical protein IKN57_11095, partial [Parasporobacterium sp.]|nr:hypothetical protein [Parasporobacterium sp.]